MVSEGLASAEGRVGTAQSTNRAFVNRAICCIAFKMQWITQKETFIEDTH